MNNKLAKGKVYEKINSYFLLGWFVTLSGCTTQKIQDHSSQPIEIYLVRHGKTYFNTTDQVQGWSDTPLTDTGKKGAVQAGKGLANIPFDYAFSSDLGRARTTAKLILAENKNKTPEIIEDERLREVFYGSYEGKSNYEIVKPLFEVKNIKVTEDTWADKWDELKAISSDRWIINQYHQNDSTHEAETYAQVAQRSKAAIKAIISKAENKGGGKVLIVTHGDQIGIILSELFPEKHFPSIPNLGLTKITYQNQTYTLDKVGVVNYMGK